MKLIKILTRIIFKLLAFTYCKNKEVLRCKINSFCFFNGNEVFGKNVNFNGCEVYGNGKIEFGDNFHSAKGLRFITSYHDYKGDAIPYNHNIITKNIIIKENVWVGMDVIILGGLTIGEGAIVQAGSVVSKSIPPLSIVGGNPVEVFSCRDQIVYFKLKNEGKFL